MGDRVDYLTTRRCRKSDGTLIYRCQLFTVVKQTIDTYDKRPENSFSKACDSAYMNLFMNLLWTS